MKIGIPKAFLYYRYSRLWECFFSALGCEVVCSGDTTRSILQRGSADCIDENCLPAKIFLGHVHALIERCDAIFVPRYDDLGKNEEFCVRFRGLYDIVQNTYPDVRLLSFDISLTRHKSEPAGFVYLGVRLGKSPVKALYAYEQAKREQQIADAKWQMEQNALLQKPQLKILLCAQPYLAHDCCVGGPVSRLIREQGGIPLYSDRCGRAQCGAESRNISEKMYWTMSKISSGAVSLYKDRVDGVILLTAFPCGTDALVNEMILRKVKDIPIIQILVDGLQGEAGLQTRIESYMDILHERRRAHAR